MGEVHTPGLLPCPFCGGKAVLVTPERGNPYVCCDVYFCTGPKPTGAQAVAAWNRRATPAREAAEDLVADAEFALKRIEAWVGDNLTDEGARDWFGHVEPALAKARAALARAKGGAS